MAGASIGWLALSPAGAGPPSRFAFRQRSVCFLLDGYATATGMRRSEARITGRIPTPPVLDMRLAGSSALLLLALLAACGIDSATVPTESALAPTSAARTLTGATS